MENRAAHLTKNSQEYPPGIWRTVRHTPTKNSLHCGGRLFVLYPFLCRDVYIIDIIRWREVITKLEGKDLACFKINRKDGSRFIDPVSPSTCVRIFLRIQRFPRPQAYPHSNRICSSIRIPIHSQFVC